MGCEIVLESAAATADTASMSKEQVDVLPDYSAELASLGRGSMIRRIQLLQKALTAATDGLEAVARDSLGGESPRLYADKVMDRVEQILRGD